MNKALTILTIVSFFASACLGFARPKPKTNESKDKEQITDTTNPQPDKVSAEDTQSSDELVILNSGPAPALDVQNMLMPGDTIYLVAQGPSKISSTLKIDERGRCNVPFLKSSIQLFGYLTIPEAIAQLKTKLIEEKAGDYVIQITKINKQGQE